MKEFRAFLSGSNRQWLMGFAIIWVIAFHFCMYGNLLHVGLLNFLFGKGYLGVDIFLFLSCYGLCYSFENRSLRDYYLQRVKRLFPIYLLFVLVLVVAYASLSPYSQVATAALQLTGLSNFFGLELEWYIPALIIIYALFPLIFKGLSLLYSLGIWWNMALVALLVVAEPMLSKSIFYLFVIRFPLIVVAVSAYFAVRENSLEKLLALFTFTALLGFCLSGREMLNGSQTGMLLLPLVLFGISQTRVHLPFEAPICFMGRHTLEIYLAQNLALNQFYATSDMNFLIKTGVAIGGIAVGSFILWIVQGGSTKFLANR